MPDPTPVPNTSEVYGPYSDLVTFTRQVLAAPTAVAAVYDVVAQQLTVAFQPVAGATTYELSVQDPSGVVTLSGGGAGSPITASGKDLVLGTAYRVVVRGVAAGVEGDWSAGVSLTPTALAAPVISSVANTADTVVVTFSSVGGANAYTAEVVDAQGRSLVPPVVASAAASPILLTAASLTAGQSYGARVRADVLVTGPASERVNASDLRGPWSAAVGFARPPPVPLQRLVGLYDTQVGYGGRTYPENHQVWVFEGGVCVLGARVTSPRWSGLTLSFDGQADATRPGKPEAANITFTQDGFSGWCRFPGEGPVDWTGRRIGLAPPYGVWPSEVFYGGRWWPEDHPLLIEPGRAAVSSVTVQAPVFGPAALAFSGQSDASRGGKPQSGAVQFAGGGFTGSCQFPQEGSLPWRSQTSSSPVSPPAPAASATIVASQQGGARGVELWAVGGDGQIWTLYQLSAGGAWSRWEGPGFKGQPKPMRQLAAAQQNNGRVMLFTLDDAGAVWSVGQSSPGGDWGGWAGPNLAGQPHGFSQIVASEQGGARGVELWALGPDGQIWTLYQTTPGGAWSRWEGPGFKGQPKPMRQLAAALQNNGCVMLFALDGDGAAWSCGQGSPGGDWGGWSGPNLAGQPHAFQQIVASQQGGTRGVELWGIGADGQVWTLYQLTAGGAWSHWEGPGFKGQARPLHRFAAALQNNGRIQFWGLDDQNALWGIGQQSPGGDWSGWSQQALPTH